MNLNIQYLTDTNGKKKAIQIPIAQWNKFIKDYKKQAQYSKLKKGIKEAFKEIKEIEKGNLKEVTLTEFLNEC